MSRQRAITLVKPPRCPVCRDTLVVHLADQWTDLDIAPKRIACPHCLFPWLPIQTYMKRSA